MDTALSLLVLTASALVFGAAWLWRRGASRKQIVLMLVLAAVLAANVVIWTLPVPGGKTLVREAEGR
jgi:hypothetical protein